LSKSEGRKFAWTLAAAFLLLAALAGWRGHATASGVLGSLVLVLGFSGLAIPHHLGPVQRAWMAMAHAISRVTTPVFMTIVYAFVITPAGLIMRLVGKNPLRHEQGDGGFWTRREGPDSDLERQF
jgi:hypothetical protein